MDALGQSNEKLPPQQLEVHAADSESSKPFSFYLSLFGLALVALITYWDVTSLSIALPVRFPFAYLNHIYVNLSDVLGQKFSLYASMGLFSIGAIVFAMAKNMSTLIAGRLIQGLGGGGLYVLQDIILADITSLKERPRYLGLLALPMALGTITGPIVGALFCKVDWRWIGWVNLPIVGVGWVIFVTSLHLRSLPLSLMARICRLDFMGMVMFAVGATAVALPLSCANALYP
ncbi:MFS general substrate transporter [Apiospora rasikravindrae]|uniref:MFS general substrate transporter n=1 Tax=Apiospora rasikravindrae TaxID=990691 RepID=A0ABR1RS21_9PEZI